VREVGRPSFYTWDRSVLYEIATLVQEREAKAGVPGSPLPRLAADFKKTWAASERSERARKQGNLRFGPTVHPSPDAYAWLVKWTEDMCSETGRTTEAVARTAWRKWLSVDGRKDARGNWVSYEHHDFTYLVTELRWSTKLNMQIREALTRSVAAPPPEAVNAGDWSAASLLARLRGET